jgi:hypothetical protein
MDGKCYDYKKIIKKCNINEFNIALTQNNLVLKLTIIFCIKSNF